MGESHGDLFGMEYVNSNGFTPVAGENRYAVGVYATGNKSRAIRNYGMNFPTAGGVPQPGKQLMIDTLNFSDMGYDVTGPQVHADGEIWSRTNFTIRRTLIDKYDDDYPADDQELQTECAEGYHAGTSVPGQPALDPARVRRDAADAGEPDHAPGTRRSPDGRPDAVRRCEPEGAVARVRTGRHGRQRLRHERERHRSDAGLRARRDEGRRR